MTTSPDLRTTPAAHGRTPLLRPATGLLALLLLAGCASAAERPGASDSDPSADRSAATSSPSGTSSEDPVPGGSASSGTPAPVAPAVVRARTARWTLVARVPDRAYVPDLASDGRVHLLLRGAAVDPEAQRWADLYAFAPTRVYDPRTGQPRRLPDDPVAWLQRHPRTEVLRTRQTRVGGEPAWQLEVERDGSELFGDRSGGFEGDGLERFVLWQERGTWFLAGGSTFRGRQALLAPDRPDDALRAFVDSLRVRDA